jgi:hypothetical protein
MLGGARGSSDRRASALWLATHVVIAYAIGGCGLDLGGLGAVPDGGTTAPTSLGDASLSPGAGVTNGADSSTQPVPGDDAATSPGETSDATVSVPSADDAALPDVQPIDSAEPGSSDGGDPCDLDQDGFRAVGQACGGTDCCDTDGRAHPGETSFFTSADACGSFDYDCNGSDDSEFAIVNCTLGFFACNGSGFAALPPACGVVATFDTCNLTVGCTTAQSQVAQGCR